MKKFALCFLLCAGVAAGAAVKLPGIFSDHAVLAKKAKVPVFGKADPGEKVVVSFNGQTKETVAGKEGKWRVDLNLANSPEGPFELKVNDLVIKEEKHRQYQWRLLCRLCLQPPNFRYPSSSSL